MEVLGNYSNQHTSNSGRGSTSNNSRNHHRPSSLQLMGVAAKHKVLQMNQTGKKDKEIRTVRERRSSSSSQNSSPLNVYTPPMNNEQIINMHFTTVHPKPYSSSAIVTSAPSSLATTALSSTSESSTLNLHHKPNEFSQLAMIENSASGAFLAAPHSHHQFHYPQPTHGTIMPSFDESRPSSYKYHSQNTYGNYYHTHHTRYNPYPNVPAKLHHYSGPTTSNMNQAVYSDYGSAACPYPMYENR